MIWCTRRGDAYALLEKTVRDHWGLVPLPSIARREGGKPYFPDHPDCHFSLSHTADLCACALSDTPVGIDIELVRPRKEGLPAYVFGEGELVWFREGGSRWEDFYTLWTLKESRCKYTGRGLDRSPRALAAPLLEPGGLGEREGLWFRTYGGEGWRAAACAARREDLPGAAHQPDLVCADLAALCVELG